MNTVLRPLLLALTLALICGSTARASRLESIDAADHPARLLAAHGVIPVASAGPYVERGSARITVIAKLGKPTERLPDGTWLYRGYRVRESDAAGVLVLHFLQDRVTSLGLTTPERAAELVASARSVSTAPHVAKQQ
jgi:hypothetical protein